jgi:hypothetical protein
MCSMKGRAGRRPEDAEGDRGAKDDSVAQSIRGPAAPTAAQAPEALSKLLVDCSRPE